MKNSNYFLALFVTFFIISCSSDDDTVSRRDSVANISNVSILVPSDVSKLYVGRGDVSADTVVIFEQGGPDYKLTDDNFEKTEEGAGEEFESIDFNNYFKDYYRVYIHQGLTLNKKGLCALAKPTNADTDSVIRVSVEILDRVIKNFKAKGKTVYVVGHSYGGFVVTKYIADRGNTSADKFLIMASRLDMQLVVAQSLSNYIPYYFKNGQIPTKNDTEDGVELLNTYLAECPIIFPLAGRMISERFTQTITANELSNVIYVYANDDEQTGDLLPSEEAFLAKKNAQVIEILATNGGHLAMFSEPYAGQINAILTK